MVSRMEISVLKTSLALDSQKQFENKELKALFEEDQSQTQEELAESLGITQQVSVRLRAMGMIQKQRNWVKWTETERRWKTIFPYEQLNQRQGFLHRIVTGDEKWIFYDNPKKKKYYAKPSQSLPSISTSTPWLNIRGSKISVSGGTKRILFTMSCWNLAIPLRAIGIGYNWFVWAVHCEKNGRNTSKDMIKLFFFMTTLGLMSLKS